MRLGVFWIETTDDSSQSHFATTWEGTGYDLRDVHGWYPLSPYPLVTVGASLLLGSTSEGSTLAALGQGNDWHPVAKGAPFHLTSAVRSDEGTVAVHAVGVGPQRQLCDVGISWVNEAEWTSPHCRDEVHVFLGNEIPVAPPRVVGLPSGDLVVVYHESYTTIAATRLHAGSGRRRSTSPFRTRASTWPSPRPRPVT